VKKIRVARSPPEPPAAANKRTETVGSKKCVPIGTAAGDGDEESIT